jgi:hypothetical protein
MAIVLDGTSGITNDSGYTGDGVSFADSTPANTLVTTSDGNVGIGTSSPNSGLHLKLTNGGGDVAARVQNSSTTAGSTATLYFTTTVTDTFNSAFVGSDRNNALILGSNTTERARIDSSGNLLVGKTASGIATQGVELRSSPGATAAGAVFTRDGEPAIACRRNTDDGAVILFASRTGSSIGSISVTATNTAYNTSSDYRLKHDIQPMTGALAKVAQLKPCTYKWNADDSESQGFIAHELQEVVPECVTGEKDAVDAEGSPQYQGIDTSFLVATLTAAIKEQQAIITALTARVEALEGAQA